MSSPSNVIRFGKNGVDGQFDDLWLPVFGGEVLTAYEELKTFGGTIRRFTMTTGNEMKFPALWKIGSEYHEAGNELLGLDIESNEYTLRLDDRPLVSHFELDDVDLAMSHFEVRSAIATQVGRELAYQEDIKIASLLINASRVAAEVNSDFPGGGFDQDGAPLVNTATIAGDKADRGGAWLQVIQDVSIKWAELDVPEMGRHLAVSPTDWYKIKDLGVPFAAADFTANYVPVFGNADWSAGQPSPFQMVGRNTPLFHNGVLIWMTNSAPFGQNITTGPAKYQGDFTNTNGIMWQEDAIGQVVLFDIGIESTRDVRRQSDFTVAKMQMGGGHLRPYAAVEINSA